MISRLIDMLRDAGLELDAREVSEILWLAPLLDPGAARTGPVSSSDTSGAPPAPPPRREAATPEAPPEKVPPPPTRAGPPTPEVEVVMPRREQGVPVRSGRGMTFRSPGAPALPNALQLGRALRPLRRRGSSRHRELDEVATAERIAREGLWLPVMRPGRSRWLELELVLDTGRSMTLWKQTLAELRTFSRYHGAFRDVRTWSLVTDGEEGRARLYRGAVGAAPGVPERDPRELLSTPAERRLIVVVSDCVSPAWHTGGVGELLRSWGHAGPVAILQMLPQRVWVRTALRHLPVVWLHGRAPGESNARLVFGRWPGALLPNPRGLVPVPTLTLERDSFANWAGVVAGRARAWTPGVLLREGGNAREVSARAREEVAPVERVRRFDAMASPLAQRLVRLLAAVPLSLPVMRLVCRTRLPAAGQVHLAEVFLGGLLEEVPTPSGSEDPEKVQYDFVPGVRELLLESVPPVESIDIFDGISRYIEERLGQTLDFQAMLEDPTAFGDEHLDESLRPFARVAAAVLRQLGGEYADLATRLEGLPPAQERPEARVRQEAARNEPPAPQGTVTAEPSTAPRRRASGKRVLVSGTAEEELPDELLRLCSLLGQGLAREGHSLVVRGRPGVEQEVAGAYVAALRELGGEPDPHFLQVLDRGSRPLLEVGRIEWVDPGGSTSSVSVSHAEVVVLLGGDEDSYKLYKVAKSSRKPVLPLPGTGGEAWNVYQHLLIADAYRWNSGISQRSLLRLNVPLSSTGPAGGVVDELLRVIHRIHPGNERIPYAKAMMDLIQTLVPSLVSGEGSEVDIGWHVLMEQFARAAGWKRLKHWLSERSSTKQGTSESVEVGGDTPDLLVLRATLPDMTEQLLEDFEQCTSLRSGWQVQQALLPLVLEYGGQAALDAVGRLVSFGSHFNRNSLLVSIVDATRSRFGSREEFESWFSAHAGITFREFEFRKNFLELSGRLARQYYAWRAHGFDSVEAELLALMRQSHLFSRDVPLEARFVRDFLSSNSDPALATAYLLIREGHLDELLPELGPCLSRASAATKMRPGFASHEAFAFTCLCACLLHRHDELARHLSWPYVRMDLASLRKELRNSQYAREDLALTQVMERLSKIVPETAETGVPSWTEPAEPRIETPKGATQWRWSGKWIAVVGTRAEQLPERIEQVGRELGAELARRGHGLMGGGWPGVDEVVGAAYAATLRTLGVISREYLLQVVDTGRLPVLGAGVTKTVREGASFSEAVSRADVVVVLGELNGGVGMFETVRSLGKPVIPLPATGNDAHAIYQRIREDDDYRARVGLPWHLQDLELDAPLSSEKLVRVAIARGLELIDQIPSAPALYAHDLLMLLRLEMMPHALPGADSAQQKWSAFFLQLVHEANEVELLKLKQRRSETVVHSVSDLQGRPASSDIAKARLETSLAVMGTRLLADFERLVEFEAYGLVGHRVLVALIPLVTRSGGESTWKSIQWLSSLYRDDAEALHALSRSLDTVGAKLLDQGDFLGALAAFRTACANLARFVESNPESARWQRELSTRLMNVGDMLDEHGQGPGAREAYQSALAIRRRLVEHYPDELKWQRDLSIIHGRVGRVLRDQGEYPRALEAFRSALAIREYLVQRDPENSQWRSELSRSREKVEELLRALKQSP
jgi:tetratricopeptide (TPR) repeat protein